MKNGRVLGVLGCSLALGLAVFTGLNLPSSGFGLSAAQRSTATGAVPADGEKGEVRVPLAPAFSARQLTALPEDHWITNGGTLFNQRYSPLSQISRSNVAGLKNSNARCLSTRP